MPRFVITGVKQAKTIIIIAGEGKIQTLNHHKNNGGVLMEE